MFVRLCSTNGRIPVQGSAAEGVHRVCLPLRPPQFLAALIVCVFGCPHHVCVASVAQAGFAVLQQERGRLGAKLVERTAELRRCLRAQKETEQDTFLKVRPPQ